MLEKIPKHQIYDKMIFCCKLVFHIVVACMHISRVLNFICLLKVGMYEYMQGPPKWVSSRLAILRAQKLLVVQVIGILFLKAASNAWPAKKRAH